jgi:hypothetical protein
VGAGTICYSVRPAGRYGSGDGQGVRERTAEDAGLAPYLRGAGLQVVGARDRWSEIAKSRFTRIVRNRWPTGASQNWY